MNNLTALLDHDEVDQQSKDNGMENQSYSCWTSPLLGDLEAEWGGQCVLHDSVSEWTGDDDEQESKSNGSDGSGRKHLCI